MYLIISIHLSDCLSMCLSIYPSLYLPNCLPICLSLYPFLISYLISTYRTSPHHHHHHLPGDSTIRDALAAATSATLAATLTTHTHSHLSSGVTNLVTSLDLILESRSKIRDRAIGDGVRFIVFDIYYLVVKSLFSVCN